jgi:hypothetical protein
LNVLKNLISTVIPVAANSYQNNQLFTEGLFNDTQIMLIESTRQSLQNNSPEDIVKVLENMEEEVSKSGLSASEQSPLFIALTFAKASASYWDNIITTPGNWGSYINSNTAVNYINLKYWTLATFESALNGYAQVQQLDTPSANILNTAGRTIAPVAALTASIGISSSKVILKLIQKPNFGTCGWF